MAQWSVLRNPCRMQLLVSMLLEKSTHFKGDSRMAIIRIEYFGRLRLIMSI